jgi:hypothetical protein
MLTAGKTPEARQELAEQTGVSPQAILELVKLSDLSRLGEGNHYHPVGADAALRVRPAARALISAID